MWVLIYSITMEIYLTQSIYIKVNKWFNFVQVLVQVWLRLRRYLIQIQFNSIQFRYLAQDKPSLG